MEWATLFTKNEDISATKAKEYINTSPQTAVQLVDVRQPKEYQKQHIPGAVLIPLSELKDRTGELTPNLPTIVYCRSGVRSKAGCQVLRDDNFTDVLNMAGEYSSGMDLQHLGARSLVSISSFKARMQMVTK